MEGPCDITLGVEGPCDITLGVEGPCVGMKLESSKMNQERVVVRQKYTIGMSIHFVLTRRISAGYSSNG